MRLWLWLLFLIPNLSFACAHFAHDLADSEAVLIYVARADYPHWKEYMQSRFRLPVIEVALTSDFSVDEAVIRINQDRTGGRYKFQSLNPMDRLLELHSRFHFHLAVLVDNPRLWDSFEAVRFVEILSTLKAEHRSIRILITESDTFRP